MPFAFPIYALFFFLYRHCCLLASCDSTPPGLADAGSAGTLGAWAAATTADSWAETEEPESLREKLLALPSEELFYSKLRKVRAPTRMKIQSLKYIHALQLITVNKNPRATV